MMSAQTTRLVVFGVLLVHGLGHGGALAALLWRRYASSAAADQAGWLAARSWALPSMAPATATTVASIFWIVAMVGFVAAALSFWTGSGTGWASLAVASSLVSLSGILLFLGTWPTFNTIAAMSVNIAVLVTQLGLHWHPMGVAG